MKFYKVLSRPDKQGTTWREIENLGPSQHKNRLFSIWGLSIMAIVLFYSSTPRGKIIKVK